MEAPMAIGCLGCIQVPCLHLFPGRNCVEPPSAARGSKDAGSKQLRHGQGMDLGTVHTEIRYTAGPRLRDLASWAPLWQFMQPRAHLIAELCTLFRVTLVIADLGWVDYDLGYSIVCLVLLGQMGIWQNWPGNWAGC